MPNRAYASLWVRGFNDANMLTHFEHFLAAVPLSAGPLGFSELVIRAVDSTEAPLEEHDLRGQGLTPAEIARIAREHHSDDVAYEVAARWDLWIREMESASLEEKPGTTRSFLPRPAVRWWSVRRVGTLYGRSRLRTPVYRPRGIAHTRNRSRSASRSIRMRRDS